jgi:hypothetical protein
MLPKIFQALGLTHLFCLLSPFSQYFGDITLNGAAFFMPQDQRILISKEAHTNVSVVPKQLQEKNIWGIWLQSPSPAKSLLPQGNIL